MSEPEDDTDRTLMIGLERLLDVVQRFDEPLGRLTPLGERIQAHLGSDVTAAPILTEVVAAHRTVDLDVALEEPTADGELLGFRGQNREHEGLEAMLSRRSAGYDLGAVDVTLAASGPRIRRRVVAFGLRLLTFDGEPVAVLQRVADRQHGREQAGVRVLARESATAERFVGAMRRLMHERSVLRGQVLTLVPRGEYRAGGESVFVEREVIPEDDVILPAGVLETVRRHVLGIAAHRWTLLAAGT